MPVSKLYVFTHEMQEKVQAFQDQWELKHDENPSEYPIAMDSAEWYEQFLGWLGLEDA